MTDCSKVKSLPDKLGKRYQVCHQQWVSLSNFKKNQNQKQHITPYAPLGTVTSTSPIHIIAVDFLKVDRRAGGYEYILVIRDQFRRYAQTYTTRNKWKTFQWFCLEIRKAKSNPARPRKGIRKQTVWLIRKVF